MKFSDAFRGWRKGALGTNGLDPFSRGNIISVNTKSISSPIVPARPGEPSAPFIPGTPGPPLIPLGPLGPVLPRLPLKTKEVFTKQHLP